jgi:hypothetical protein
MISDSLSVVDHIVLPPLVVAESGILNGRGISLDLWDLTQAFNSEKNRAKVFAVL